MKIAPTARNRWLKLAAFVCLVAVGAPALRAQGRQLPSTPAAASGPRALALLELAPDGRARLVPIAIRINNKFYDAGLYRARPRPMAVDPQTVYEVQRSGEPAGLFTVTRALTTKDVWIGLGQWRPGKPEAAAKKITPAPRIQAGPPDVGERPVLKRPAGSASQSSPADSAEPKPAAKPTAVDEDRDRPTLKRPGSSSAEADDSRPTMRRPAPPDSTAAADDDARPALKRPAGQPAPAEDADPDRPALKRPAREERQSASRTDSDSERPTLRRGKPATQLTTDETAPAITNQPGASPVLAVSTASAGAATGGMKLEVLPAISDAKVQESRSFLMMLNPIERQQLEGKVQAVAYAAVQKWASTRPVARPAAAGQLQVSNFQVFNYNNDPVAVFSAELPGAAAAPPIRRTAGASAATASAAAVDPSFRFFVTVVVRRDMYGELRTLLTQVTDHRHLDAYARFELIDAVDGEGSRTAQLLFRRVGDRSFSYALYRVAMDRCWPIFESAGKDL